MLFVFCNPLCDLIVGVESVAKELGCTGVIDVFRRYGLKENSSNLASEGMEPLKKAALKYGKVELGGSGLNTARCACAIATPTYYFGAIGNDFYGKLMQDRCACIGNFHAKFQINESHPTGTCVALLNEYPEKTRARTLVADLGAAVHFSHYEFITTTHNISLLTSGIWTRVIYITGFFETSSCSTVAYLSELRASRSDIKLAFNLSAEFILYQYSNELARIFPTVDILFGNAEELKVLLESNGDLESFSKKYPQMNVIITNGANPTLYARNGVIAFYPVIAVPENEVIDTVGAGDAFVAGFLSNYLKNEDIKMSISMGHMLASKIIRVPGVQEDNLATAL